MITERLRRATMRLGGGGAPMVVSIGAVAVAAMAIVLGAAAGSDGDRPTSIEGRAAAVYDFNCAACHGTTGGGLAEARTGFPADHAACERCHLPGNPARMTLEEMDLWQTAFSLGDPPRLDDRERLARFGTGAALEHFVAATMPRWNPGSLDEVEVRLATVYVLHLSGALDLAAVGDLDSLDLAHVRLDDGPGR